MARKNILLYGRWMKKDMELSERMGDKPVAIYICTQGEVLWKSCVRYSFCQLWSNFPKAKYFIQSFALNYLGVKLQNLRLNLTALDKWIWMPSDKLILDGNSH